MVTERHIPLVFGTPNLRKLHAASNGLLASKASFALMWGYRKVARHRGLM